METIKFRAWSKEESRLIYFDLTEIEIPGRVLYGDDYILNLDTILIEQFTGLQDKNGKDIYEGDILNEIRYPPNKMGSYDSIPVFVKDNEIVVGFKDGCFVAEPGSHLWRYICNYNDESKTDYEIIGNIHENKELLK